MQTTMTGLSATSGVVDTGMTTENTTVIHIWDTVHEFWIEIKLEAAIEAARAAYLQLKAEGR
jgi:hypothetical protein